MPCPGGCQVSERTRLFAFLCVVARPCDDLCRDVENIGKEGANRGFVIVIELDKEAKTGLKQDIGCQAGEILF